ncbi:hypothetical protein VTL71DRAFT_6692, partial [Oculimacula yallundae]
MGACGKRYLTLMSLGLTPERPSPKFWITASPLTASGSPNNCAIRSIVLQRISRQHLDHHYCVRVSSGSMLSQLGEKWEVDLRGLWHRDSHTNHFLVIRRFMVIMKEKDFYVF